MFGRVYHTRLRVSLRNPGYRVLLQSGHVLMWNDLHSIAQSCRRKFILPGCRTFETQDVRQTLYDELVKLNPDKDWSFVTRQIGMFSFTGEFPACMLWANDPSTRALREQALPGCSTLAAQTCCSRDAHLAWLGCVCSFAGY